MPEIQKVRRSHYCNKCKKRLTPDNDRIHFEYTNYCISCGYEVIKDKINELNNFLSKLKREYGKEIVINKLTK